MLEYWNDGIMGFGKMGQWFIGKIPLDMEIDNVIEKNFVLTRQSTMAG